MLEIFRTPDALPRTHVHFKRRVQNFAGRRVAIVQRSGIDEGLEAGAGLALRLHGAVEL